jgi:hypothetical protein
MPKIQPCLLASKVHHTHHVIGPILDDENELVQIINVKLWSSQINDNTSNTKDLFYLNLWTHNAKELMNQEKNIGKLYCMICPPNKGFSIFANHKGIVETIGIHFSMWK